MVRRVRSHFAHNVVGYLALTVALSGTAYAQGMWGSEDIKDGSIESVDIKDNTIRGADVRNGRLQRNDLEASVLPSIRLAALGPGEYPTSNEFAEVASLDLRSTSSNRYLVVANFTASGAIPFDCELSTDSGDKRSVHVNPPGSQTLVLIVNAPTIARLWCGDHNPQGISNLAHPTLTALRVSTENP